MEVTALCFRLMLELLVLLLVPVHHSYFAQADGAAFPRVRPDRLQFFEYEAVTVNCDEFRGLTEWRVMTKLNKIDPTNSYDSSGPSLKIHPALKRHSGEFWCEDGEGNRSRAVNISVTDGFVILEVPARPVIEGTKLILHCKEKNTDLKPVADFYKDASKLRTLYKEDLIIQKVSKSDEGLYRCSISGPGASPESWLAVSPQTEGAAFPRVRPDRLQFFEYEAVTVNCDEFRGLTEWRVMTKLNKIDPTNSYNSSAPTLNIDLTYKRHSGEYWCEDGEGNRGRAINISVTDGSVILDIPAHPVVIGTKVILHCKNKKTESKHIAFYKDGSRVQTWYREDLIIQNVSKSDEGFYRCSYPTVGESPESWLAVLQQNEVPAEDARPPRSKPQNLLSLLWMVALVTPLLLLAKKQLFRGDHKELDVSEAGNMQRLADDGAVYTTVYYRPLDVTAGPRRWSVQDSAN